MNLKYFYYRAYFEDKKLNLRQPVSKDDREQLDKNKESILKAQNHTLCGANERNLSLETGSKRATLGNVEPLYLYVQNPGLLPGIGYPHEVGYAGELKLGMHFDHTTGLPCLPGSSVKGALRAWWPQYDYAETNPAQYQPNQDKRKPDKADLQAKKARFILKALQKIGVTIADTTDAQAFVHRLELALFEGWKWDTDDGKPARTPLSKRAVFFDAFPIKFSETRDGQRLLGRDALTPHGDDPLKNPTPLPFLKVVAGVQFAFPFRLFDLKIEGIDITKEQLRTLFAHLLEKAGAGAKTNVGYGRFAATIAPPPVAGNDTTKERNVSASDNRNTHKQDSGGASPTPTRAPLGKELANYDGKVKAGVTELQAQLVRAGKPFSEVDVLVKGERYTVQKATGTMPDEPGRILRVRVMEVSKATGRITQVSLIGLI